MLTQTFRSIPLFNSFLFVITVVTQIHNNQLHKFSLAIIGQSYGEGMCPHSDKIVPPTQTHLSKTKITTTISVIIQCKFTIKQSLHTLILKLLSAVAPTIQNGAHPWWHAVHIWSTSVFKTTAYNSYVSFLDDQHVKHQNLGVLWK